MTDEPPAQGDLVPCPRCKSQNTQWNEWFALKDKGRRRIFLCLDCNTSWTEGIQELS